MIFQQANRSDPEQIFGIYYNAEGASLPADAVVALDNSTTCDGNRIVQPNTGALGLVVGVLNASLASAAYGKVQIYGYRATSIVLTTDTSLVTGLMLIPVAGQNYLASGAADNASAGRFGLMESHTTSTGTVSKKIFIRAM